MADGQSNLRIETDPVLAAVDQFRTIADDLRQGLQRLVGSANDVVGASWRGEASSAFRREWDDFEDAAKAIVEDADTIADLVTYSVNAYVAEDKTSAAVLRSVWVNR
jgi:WXG100 family type VII secretion target